MARLRYNGLTGTLGAALTTSATSVTFGAALTHANGVAVPTITGSDYIPLTILDSSGNFSEIVYLTAYATGATTGTITRAAEGSGSAVAHNSGDRFVHGATKGDYPATGGTAGQALVKNSATEGDWGWAKVSGLFRGEWVADSVAYTQTFSGGTIPSPFTTSIGGAGATPTVVASNTQASGAPPGGYTSAAQMVPGNIQSSANYSRLSLSLSSLNISNITRVRFWRATFNGSSNGATSITAQERKNGVAFESFSGAVAWAEIETTAVSTDTVDFQAYGSQGTNGPTGSGLLVTGIRVFASQSPYMSGEYATYAGQLWRSAIDNNGSTPGADSNWVRVSLGGKPINAQTGTSYALALSDSSSVVTMNNASPSTVNLPANATVTYPVGTNLDVIQIGAGQSTVVPASGVTINGANSQIKTTKNYARIGFTKIATDAWVASGDFVGLLGGTASSTIPTYQSYVPGNVLDGNMTTEWYGGRAAVVGDTFTVDFGASKTITAASVMWKTSWGSDVTEISTDNTTWTAYSSGNTATARYIRLRNTGGNGQWPEIYEFQITGY